MPQIAVIARIVLSAESAPKYVEAAREMIGPTRAEAGCELYGMGPDISDPRVIWVSEQWASQEDLDAHLKAPHVQKFLARIADLDMLDIEVRSYAVDEVGTVVMPE